MQPSSVRVSLIDYNDHIMDEGTVLSLDLREVHVEDLTELTLSFLKSLNFLFVLLLLFISDPDMLLALSKSGGG